MSCSPVSPCRAALLALVALSLLFAAGCATSLPARMPDVVPYDEVPLELPTGVPGGVPEGEPEVDLPPTGALDDMTPPTGLPPTGDLPAGETPAGTTPEDAWLPSGEGGVPDPTADAPRARAPAVATREPSRAPRPGAGLPPRGGGPVPSRPRPPTWDPSRDRTVRLGPDGRPLKPTTAQGSPDDEEPSGSPDGPESVPGAGLPPPADDDAWAPGGGSAPLPPARDPVDDPGTAARKPAGGLGAPPGGAAGSPFPSEAPAGARPPQADPAPTAPQPTPRETPAPPADNPWVPGGTAPTPSQPTPTQPTPTQPVPQPPAGDDPWVPGGADTRTPAAPPLRDPNPVAPPAGAPDDPWLPAGGETAPKPPVAKPPADAADPWEDAGEAGMPSVEAPPTPKPAPAGGVGSGGVGPGGASTGGYVGKTAEARALEHTTRLMDDPGNAAIPGFPAAILASDPPGHALTQGKKPAVLVFFDDASRASDVQAARLLSLLVRYRAQIDFVAVDRGAGATRTGGGEELAGRYLDKIPTVVLLDSERKTRLYKTGALTADELERALDLCLTGSPLPKDPGVAPTEDPGRKTPSDPFDVPTPDPASDTPESRGGMTFSPPAKYTAKQHAQRLKGAPGDVTVPGYPAGLVPSAPADRVLTTSVKPVVILFYDDASKVSDLQAAEFLPTLVKHKDEVDFVLIDVSTRARWNDAQKKVVRTYYNFYVPTTVVLAPNRAPIKSWYSRTEAASLERALDQAVGRAESGR